MWCRKCGALGNTIAHEVIQIEEGGKIEHTCWSCPVCGNEWEEDEAIMPEDAGHGEWNNRDYYEF